MAAAAVVVILIAVFRITVPAMMPTVTTIGDSNIQASGFSGQSGEPARPFAPDKYSLPGRLFFNRTITLKDAWAKEARKS